MNFVHQSIATNGIALVIRKTPAKIRLEKEKLIEEDYFTPAIHDFLIKCVEGHCNIMVAGETGSGKTEFVKYLASHTKTNEKIITIEDTLELHLDKIFPQRDIVSMKTNNVASYSDVLVTCMRQNPKWILLSEVRSAEAVSAVRNSISSGHNILSTIHADKASAIPYRLYSLMETDLDVHQFLTTIYRYIQLGVHIKAFYSKQYGKFHRELDEVAEFYVDDNNEPKSRIIYQKIFGKPMMCRPSDHLVEYLENQNIEVEDIIKDLPRELPLTETQYDDNIGDTTDNDSSGANNDSSDANNDSGGNAQVASVQLGNELTGQVPDSNVQNEVIANVSITPVVEESATTNAVPVVDATSANSSAEMVNGQEMSIPTIQAGTNNVQLAATPVVQAVVPQQQEVISQPVINAQSVVEPTVPIITKLEE